MDRRAPGRRLGGQAVTVRPARNRAHRVTRGSGGTASASYWAAVKLWQLEQSSWRSVTCFECTFVKKDAADHSSDSSEWQLAQSGFPLRVVLGMYPSPAKSSRLPPLWQLVQAAAFSFGATSWKIPM